MQGPPTFPEEKGKLDGEMIVGGVTRRMGVRLAVRSAT